MDKPIPEALAAEAAALLTTWLDEEECECEPYGHSCGRPNVIRVRDDLLALTAAQQQGQAVDCRCACHLNPNVTHAFPCCHAPPPSVPVGDCPNCMNSQQCDECSRGEWDVIAQQSPPPSAPVGVEGLPPDVQEIVRQDEAGWALAKLAESHGARRDEDDNGTWWVLDIGHFKALAQQPAADPFEREYRAARAAGMGFEDAWHAAIKTEQQPAAVDGFDAWYDEYSKQNYSEMMLAEAAWSAGIAAAKLGESK